MTSSPRLAGTVALCAALLLGACEKKTDQTTTASTDTTVTTPAPAGDVATAAPDLSATVAPDSSASTSGASPTPSGSGTTATTSSGTTTASVGSGTNGSGSGGFVTLPVYPGATENKDGAMSAQTNTGSVEMHVYMSKDDTKRVADWYRAHLPASFKGGTVTNGDRTVGTWADEHADKSGDQSVVVMSDDATKQTRIQLSTKHGQ